MLLIMILSIIPATASDIESHSHSDADDEFPVNVGGTRADIRKQNVTFESGGTTVSGTYLYEPIAGKRPAVVFGVGYSAQATVLYDCTNYCWLAEYLAAEGYVVLVIRYWANYENPMELLNLTGDYSLWVQQTRDAVTALTDNGLTGTDGAITQPSTIVDPARIALGGHSIGGAVSIVSGAQDRRIKTVFVLSPQNYAGTPRMNSFIDEMSPTPIQLQVGELDELGGVATVEQSYNVASSPKHMVKYRYGTYEGFTDLGNAENINIDDVPSAIRDPLGPILQVNPLSTKQHDQSKMYTKAFLDYYLMNDDSGFDFKSDYSEGYIITNPPLPPQEIPDVWHSTVSHQGLDVIFQSASTSPDELDFQDGNSISVRARITPKGIWEKNVDAVLTFPEGTTESYEMTYNDDYDVDAGYYSVELTGIPASHSLGFVTVNITAKDYDDVVHTYDGLSFELTTSSPTPTVDSITHSPDPIVPGEEITFTISASDPEGDAVPYFYMDFGDGSNSGWVESNMIDHTFAESGQYNIRVQAKDDKAAESDEKLLQRVASNPPEADLEVDSSVKEGDPLVLDASASSDPDGDDLEYLFIFGDGIESGWVSSSTIDHRYDELGDVTVTLKVRDEWGRESQEVQATVKVKENKGDSVISSVTSSSGFPIMVIIIVLIIVIGGIVLLRGDEESQEEKEAGRKMETKKRPKPASGVPMARSVNEGGDSQGPLKKGRPIPRPKAPGDRTQPIGTKDDGTPVPMAAAARESPKEPEIDAPPVVRTQAPPPITPQAPPPPIPAAPPGQQAPTQTQPEPPTPQDPPSEPEIDAPPITPPVSSGNDEAEDGESWDDFEDEDSDESGDQQDDWEDEDFAIPVALKEKLQESE